jgi:signal transduction histidine kinase
MMRFSHRGQSLITTILVVLAATTATVSLATPQSSDNLALTIYLGTMAALVMFASVAVEHGTMNLATIPLQSAAILLNPRDTLLVALIASVGSVARRPGAIAMVAGRIYWTTVPELLRTTSLVNTLPQSAQLLVVVITFTAINWIIVGLVLSFARREPILIIWRRTLTRTWLWIIGYFTLAVVLLVHVLDGSAAGYAFGMIVAALSFALSDTVAARRARALLERQITDADRHLLYSRAVEGVLHNLRNHLAAIKGHLDNVPAAGLSDNERLSIAVSRSATIDALAETDRLAAGASPKVVVADAPVDLRRLAEYACMVAEPQARLDRVHLVHDSDPTPLWVAGDPLLLREVLTNLLVNAIEATREGGTVRITCGIRSDGYFVRVSDDGLGISPSNREHLFEPHFTTKEHGTGMGLFVSYGIIREHQGRLLYEGDKRGAVFTVVLPPAPATTEPVPSSRQA